MEESSKLSPGNSDIELNETEDSIGDELPYKEEQTQPTSPPVLPAVSVMKTPQNVSWSNYPAIITYQLAIINYPQTNQTSSYSAFGFQRTDYDLRPRHNKFISFADTDFEMGQTSASREV